MPGESLRTLDAEEDVLVGPWFKMEDVLFPSLTSLNGLPEDVIVGDSKTVVGEDEPDDSTSGDDDTNHHLNRKSNGGRSSSSSSARWPAGSMSKNAIAARENRVRKKKYVQGLEESIRALNAENRILKERVSTLDGTVDRLQSEVEYLHGVLANVDEISLLLKSVRSTSDLRVACRVRSPSEEDVNPSVKRCRRDDEESKSSNSSGVCFHVNGGKVSLEFCPECSTNAAANTG